jgi:hypothetical protein
MPINYLELVDGITFPTTRVEIIDWAQRHGASEEAIEAFRAMPEDYFRDIREVNRNIQLIGRLPD